MRTRYIIKNLLTGMGVSIALALVAADLSLRRKGTKNAL
jgi:hypothetical protein